MCQISVQNVEKWPRYRRDGRTDERTDGRTDTSEFQGPVSAPHGTNDVRQSSLKVYISRVGQNIVYCVTEREKFVLIYRMLLYKPTGV